MLIPLLTSLRADKGQNGVSMEAIYRHVGISRQLYFQAKKREDLEVELMAEIEELVSEYRIHKDRRAGSRSLYYNLNIKEQYSIGVNKFEFLMSKHRLTLAPLRVKIVTTKSSLQSWNYADCTPGLLVNNINQLVVGDLTYVNIGRYLYYLFCLTDLYSAHIVGYHLGKRMRAEEAKVALDKWFKKRGSSALNQCIHHTDGGSQYFSRLYLRSLNENGVCISVAKNCLDNAHAEQRNGFIKHHLIPTLKVTEGNKLDKEIEKMFYFYNSERKQEALGWLSPVEFEEKWQNKSIRPVLRIHDRRNNKPSERFFKE